MELNNVYLINGKEINVALEELDEALTIFNKILEIKDGYSYDINIEKVPDKDLWNIEIQIRYGKQKDEKSLEGAIEPPQLL